MKIVHHIQNSILPGVVHLVEGMSSSSNTNDSGKDYGSAINTIVARMDRVSNVNFVYHQFNQKDFHHNLTFVNYYNILHDQIERSYSDGLPISYVSPKVAE